MSKTGLVLARTGTMQHAGLGSGARGGDSGGAERVHWQMSNRVKQSKSYQTIGSPSSRQFVESSIPFFAIKNLFDIMPPENADVYSHLSYWRPVKPLGTMNSLSTTQEPLHDLALVESNATPDADLTPPAVEQLSTSDGAGFENNCLVRPEISNISSGSSSIPKSSLDETRLATPVPASLPHDFPESSLDQTKYTTPVPHNLPKSSLEQTRSATPVPASLPHETRFTTPVPHNFPRSSMEETRLATPVPVSIHSDSSYKASPSLPASMTPHFKNDPEDFEFSTPQAYVAIDPFAPSVAQSVANFHYSRPTATPSHIEPQTMQHPQMEAHSVIDTPASSYILAFLLDTLPRQIYLYFLFTLPSLYFSRVARIFEEAELSMPDIKRMAIESANNTQDPLWFPSAYGFPPVMRLKTSWEQFIDSLTKEWKTLNLVSILLLSAILTTLQIDGALTDPYTRYLAFLALVCSLMSLLYGCIYIVRFSTMRRTHKAAEWAEEAQKTKTSIWWNVWVLLATPAIWLSWSIVLYSACILTFVWRTGTTSDTVLQITPLAALGPRLAVTFTFILGLIYLCLIIREFRRYGVVMDKAWRERVLEWTRTSQNMYGGPSKGKSFPNEHRFSMEEKAFPNRQGPYPWGVGSWGVGPIVPPSLRSVQTSDNPLQSLGLFVSPPLVYPQTSVNPSQSLGPRPLDLLNRFPQRDHTQIPLETISEVSISTSRHSLQSDAGVAEGEDENSPVEEDGHDKRVSSSYPQSSLQFGRLTPTETSVVSDEQRDALSALRDHDVSRGDRQPDQYHLRSAEYNLDDLVGRPNDWRWDYGVRRTIDAGARTSIDEFRDPIERTISATLSYVHSNTCVTYDLRFFPDSKTLFFPILGRVHNHIDFTQLATNPPVDQMRLFHPLLPWYIDVYKKIDSGVTVGDVIMQIYIALQSPIDARQYYNEELGSEIRGRIARAYQWRTQGTAEKLKGIKRVDYLEDRCIFVGLVKSRDGMWEIQTR